MKFIRCQKCGSVYQMASFYGRGIGSYCGMELEHDARKQYAAAVKKCHARLRAEDIFEAPNFKEAKATYTDER